MNKYFLPYDVYERHKKVGSLIVGDKTVLDVGGELNHLSKFCKAKKIVVANLKTGDVIITKEKLPFGENSFDVVTSIDVLEHISKNKRKEFINRLVETARDLVILSFPIGTKEHLKYEKEMIEYLKSRGEKVSYIEEHVKFGLPTRKDLDEMLKNLNSKTYFSGNIYLNGLLFKIHLSKINLKFIDRAFYWLKLLFNFISNPIFYRFLMDKPYSQTVNRVYLLIGKK